MRRGSRDASMGARGGELVVAARTEVGSAAGRGRATPQRLGRERVGAAELEGRALTVQFDPRVGAVAPLGIADRPPIRAQVRYERLRRSRSCCPVGSAPRSLGTQAEGSERRLISREGTDRVLVLGHLAGNSGRGSNPLWGYPTPFRATR